MSLILRTIKPADYGFIQSLAAEQRGFTIPSSYSLWMFSTFNPSLSVIAEDSSRGPVAYTLGLVSVQCPRNIFVWQLASSFGGRRSKAPILLVEQIKHAAIEVGAASVLFTAIAGDTKERWLESLAQRVFGTSVERLLDLPPEACPDQGERLHKINLKLCEGEFND